jgi:hypothetical protein
MLPLTAPDVRATSHGYGYIRVPGTASQAHQAKGVKAEVAGQAVDGRHGAWGRGFWRARARISAHPVPHATGGLRRQAGAPRRKPGVPSPAVQVGGGIAAGQPQVAAGLGADGPGGSRQRRGGEAGLREAPTPVPLGCPCRPAKACAGLIRRLLHPSATEMVEDPPQLARPLIGEFPRADLNPLRHRCPGARSL